IFEPSLSLAIRETVGMFIPQIDNIIKLPPTHVADFFIRVVKETVDYREKNNIKRNDFMQLLIELRNKAQLLDDYENTELSSTDNELPKVSKTQNGTSKDSDDIELTDSLLAAQAFVFFAAGYETSATTMGFALHELAMNLDVQDKLQVELDSVLGEHNGEFSYESIQKMNYLDKVIQETLRKYPPLPNHFRRCTVPYIIPGTKVRLEKGTRVFIPILGLQMDPAYFPDPHKFDPERFSEENKATRPRFAYLPFGEGPRNCI
ncbi:Cytochrome P450 6k1, partial [Gryllus bimaculatus]